MKLIVVADDFGYSEIRDNGILECYKAFKKSRYRGVSDYSILVNGKNFQNFKQADFIPGLHLNLTEGIPLVRPSSLVNNNDCMYGKKGFRALLSEQSILISDIEKEIDSQIVAFMNKLHAPPSHIDGHQHVHVIPEVVNILEHILPRKNIKWCRIPEDFEFINSSISSFPNISEDQYKFYTHVSRQAREARTRLQNVRVNSAHYFLGMNLMGSNLTLENLNIALKRIQRDALESQSYDWQEVIVELMVHPGYSCTQGDPFSGCGQSSGPDEFSQSSDREFEMMSLMNISNLLKDYNIHMISYQDLQKTRSRS